MLKGRIKELREDWGTVVQAALNTYYGGTYDPPEKHP